MRKGKNPRHSIILIFFLILLFFINCGNKVEAAQKEEPQAGETDLSLMEELDFTGLDEILRDQEITKRLDFKELAKKLIAGEEIDKKWLLHEIGEVLFGELGQSKGYLIQIILLVAAFALLYNFSNVFENAAVTDISFYIVYMIMMVLFMKSFLIMSDILNETLKNMMEFMMALLPAFSLSMMFSTGAASAMGFYQLTLFLVYLIEMILLYLLVPAIRIYIILELLNNLTKEELISKMTELIENGVRWVLKGLFALVIGINVVQGLLNPVIDGFKNSAFARTAGMIPGVGNSIQGVAEIMLGSGIIIKNGIGVAGIFVLLLLCAGPMIKVGVLTLLYKLAGAVVQPIADKRLAGCICGMGKGAGLLGKVLITANAMLLVTIALVSAVTTWNR